MQRFSLLTIITLLLCACGSKPQSAQSNLTPGVPTEEQNIQLEFNGVSLGQAVADIDEKQLDSNGNANAATFVYHDEEGGEDYEFQMFVRTIGPQQSATVHEISMLPKTGAPSVSFQRMLEFFTRIYGRFSYKLTTSADNWTTCYYPDCNIFEAEAKQNRAAYLEYMYFDSDTILPYNQLAAIDDATDAQPAITFCWCMKNIRIFLSLTPQNDVNVIYQLGGFDQMRAEIHELLPQYPHPLLSESLSDWSNKK